MEEAMLIDEKVAEKVLEVVDAGLVAGVGKPVPGEMCVEAAVCYAMGLPHGDDPACVSPSLLSLKITLNDAVWSSTKARAVGLRRLALAQLGSRDALNEAEFVRRVAELAIRKQAPKALRAAASMPGNKAHAESLEAAAVRCEEDGDNPSAAAARAAAARAADAADGGARAAARAAARASDAAYAAYGGARAARAAYAAYAAYASDAAYAAYAADAAAYAAYAADAAGTARDTSLAEFAEQVVQVLIEMGAPGCQWLYLCPVPEGAKV